MSGVSFDMSRGFSGIVIVRILSELSKWVQRRACFLDPAWQQTGVTD
jgi:hypothetical protein